MKKLMITLLVLVPIVAFSQHLEIIEVDTSDYPIVSAKFIALDENFKILKDLTIDESSIVEDDEERNIIKIINPKDTNIMQSVVLVVDVSGSMSGTNIELVKMALTDFINLTPFSFTELSILSFDTDLYVNQDFTRNKTKLLSCVKNLRAGGGTDYDVALLENKNSALNILSGRKNSKPVIIFLTDGLSSANYEKISNFANDKGAKIYCITLNMPMPFDLAEITNQTNAKYFENIKNTDEAKKAYLSILFEIYDLYGTIYWEAERPCEDLINFTFSARKKYQTSYFYEISASQTKGIYFNKILVAFDLFLNKKTDEIEILANTPATIKSIKIKDTTYFNLSYDFELPAIINPGEKLVIKVDAYNSDKETYTEVEVETDVCPAKKFYIFQGNIANFSIPGNLILLTPNGGENFYSGSYTDIKWRNKTPNKFVNLYLSTDNGNNYTWINQNTKPEYNWLIPGTVSDSCLIKVNIITDPILLKKNSATNKEIKVSGDGNNLIFNDFRNLYYESVSSGDIIRSIHTKRTLKDYKISQLSNNTIFKTGNKLYSYDFTSDKIKTIKHKKGNILDYFFFNNEKKIVIFYKNSPNFYIFDAKTGRKTKKIKVGSPITTASFKNSTASIITSDKKWIIYDASTDKILYELENKNDFNQTDVNYDGQYAAVIDKKGKIFYWSKTENDTIISFNHNKGDKIDILKFGSFMKNCW